MQIYQYIASILQNAIDYGLVKLVLDDDARNHATVEVNYGSDISLNEVLQFIQKSLTDGKDTDIRQVTSWIVNAYEELEKEKEIIENDNDDIDADFLT